MFDWDSWMWWLIFACIYGWYKLISFVEGTPKKKL